MGEDIQATATSQNKNTNVAVFLPFRNSLAQVKGNAQEKKKPADAEPVIPTGQLKKNDERVVEHQKKVDEAKKKQLPLPDQKVTLNPVKDAQDFGKTLAGTSGGQFVLVGEKYPDALIIGSFGANHIIERQKDNWKQSRNVSEIGVNHNDPMAEQLSLIYGDDKILTILAQPTDDLSLNSNSERESTYTDVNQYEYDRIIKIKPFKPSEPFVDPWTKDVYLPPAPPKKPN